MSLGDQVIGNSGTSDISWALACVAYANISDSYLQGNLNMTYQVMISNYMRDLPISIFHLENLVFEEMDSWTLINVSEDIAQLELSARNLTFRSLTMNGNIFQSSHTPEYANLSNIQIYDSVFSNITMLSGSPVHLGGRSNMTFENCSFSNIQSSTSGGVFVSSSSLFLLSFTHCRFENISSERFGGIIYYAQGGLIEFSDSSFSHISHSNGGIFYMDLPYVWSDPNTQARLLRCNITNIAVQNHGGIGFFLEKTSIIIEDVNMQANTSFVDS